MRRPRTATRTVERVQQVCACRTSHTGVSAAIFANFAQAHAKNLQTHSSCYTSTAIALHWVLAVLILAQLAVGWLFHDWLAGDARALAFEWHKTLGVTILLLSLARLTWRLLHRPPPYPATMPAWERAAAWINHWLLYVVMIGLPLTGYAAVSTGRRALEAGYMTILGGVPLPLLPLPQGAHHRFEEAHEFLVWSTIALLALHLGAVLKHLLIDRDEVPGRMISILRRRA
ncbi:MAG: cytochrome b [Lysobacterales bacterium]